MLITKNCLHCDAEFTTKQTEINRGFGKYCSLRCARHHRELNKQPPKPNTTCAFCGTNFYQKPYRIKENKSGFFFCCRQHKDLAQKHNSGIDFALPHYKNGVTAYRQAALDAYGAVCNQCGYDKHIECLVVHHKDENRKNSDITNLVVLCLTCHGERHLVK